MKLGGDFLGFFYFFSSFVYFLSGFYFTDTDYSQDDGAGAHVLFLFTTPPCSKPSRSSFKAIVI